MPAKVVTAPVEILYSRIVQFGVPSITYTFVPSETRPRGSQSLAAVPVPFTSPLGSSGPEKSLTVENVGVAILMALLFVLSVPYPVTVAEAFKLVEPLFSNFSVLFGIVAIPPEAVTVVTPAIPPLPVESDKVIVAVESAPVDMRWPLLSSTSITPPVGNAAPAEMLDEGSVVKTSL